MRKPPETIKLVAVLANLNDEGEDEGDYDGWQTRGEASQSRWVVIGDLNDEEECDYVDDDDDDDDDYDVGWQTSWSRWVVIGGRMCSMPHCP